MAIKQWWNNFRPADFPLKCQGCGLELPEDISALIEDGKPVHCPECGAYYQNVPIDYLIDRYEDR